jgi:hypothetical protein
MSLQQLNYTQIRGAPVNVQGLGADPTGVADSTIAIQAALDIGGAVYFPQGTYKVTSTLSINSNTSIDAGTAVFAYSNGATPFFSINTKQNISIQGGVYAGTASAWLAITGTGTGAAGAGTYSRDITITGVSLSTPLTTLGLDIQNSSRHIFISDSMFQCQSGVHMTNKVVEVEVTNCLFFGDGSGVGSFGWKIDAPAGGSANPEGIFITNCHVDFYETGFIVSDVFVFGVTQGYYGGSVAAFTFPTTSTVIRNINITGAVINQGSTVGPFSAGKQLRLNFSACTFVGNTANSIDIFGNSFLVAVDNCIFESSSGIDAIICRDNTGSIRITNNTIDSTYGAGVDFIGSNGAGNLVADNVFLAAGNMIGALGRPVNLSNNTISTTFDSTLVMPFDTIASAAYATSAELASLTLKVAKGQKGKILMGLNVTSVTGGGYLEVGLPAQAIVPFSMGLSGKYIAPAATASYVGVSIPFYANADIDGSVAFSLTNFSMTSIAIGSHSWFAVVLD